MTPKDWETLINDLDLYLKERVSTDSDQIQEAVDILRELSVWAKGELDGQKK
jgi:hypothetical protein